jgi:hypothetical protein
MKITLLIFMIVFVSVFVGCATAGSIDESYKRVNLSDGISKEEAALIAKKHLSEEPEKKDFQIISPVILNNAETKKYPHIWFIRFHPKNILLIDKYYLVMVSKDTGEIISYGVRQAGKQNK